MRNGTTAVILAAGPGSRLLPRTADTPKCLTPVAGQPILAYQIAALRQCGIHDIVMVVGYRSDKIRAFVDASVTLVENPEFASTNSSYSLWLARTHLRDGFLHLNSDLVFDPGLLRALLDAPDENAVIVDRKVRPDSDMMKAQMNGRHILRMSKTLADDAAAEVVGPAKFGPAGADLVIGRLRQLTAGGNRSSWAYSVFGDLAPSLPLVGVDNPGCFWAEVDTTADAAEADRRIPRSLVQLARRGQESRVASSVSSDSEPALGGFPTHAS